MPKKKNPALYEKNLTIFRRMKERGLFPPEPLNHKKGSPQAKIFGRAIGPVLATEPKYPTAEQKRQSQRKVFVNLITEVAKASHIPLEEREALLKLARLFARHINATHQPDEILRNTFNITPEEVKLAKKISQKSVATIFGLISRIRTKIPFDTFDRYAAKEEFPNDPEKEELAYLSKQIYFRITHDVFHSAVSFHTLFEAARKQSAA